MSASVNKLIVTNFAALTGKYGPGGAATVQTAVSRLVAADARKGLATALVAMDDATAMKKYGVAPVTGRGNQKQNKAAVDGLYRATAPDYLMILGAPDVVPHQDLTNPADDEDPSVPSDLPYACEAGYGTEVGDFTAPTRVVGRLPDFTGGSDPNDLVGVIDAAANAAGQDAGQFANEFGVSADVWKKSTAMSLQAVFGSPSDLQVVPPDGVGGKWPANLLKRRPHFFNCHGAGNDYRFYGQPDGAQEFPVAYDSTLLAGKITEGTVVAAECCYGAQLYNPATAGGNPGICNTYLKEKAYGFFGSTTIAYGPSDQNDAADLMCQYFFNHILKGASTGRAALQARQDFLAARTPLDPQNLKTLGQYLLLGDPSVHPVLAAPGAEPAETAAAVPKGGARGAAKAVPAILSGFDPYGLTRALVRSRLLEVGTALGNIVRVARAIDAVTPPRAKRALSAALKGAGIEARAYAVRSFSIEPTGGRPARGARARAPKRMAAKGAAAAGPVAFHVATVRIPSQAAPMQQYLAVVATEIQDRYLIKHLYSR